MSLVQSSQGDEHLSSTRKVVEALFLSMLNPEADFVTTVNDVVGAGALGTVKVPMGMATEVVIWVFVFNVISWPTWVHASNWDEAVVHPEFKVKAKLEGTVITMNPPTGIGFVGEKLRV